LTQQINTQTSLFFLFCNGQHIFLGRKRGKKKGKKLVTGVQLLIFWWHAPHHYDEDDEAHRTLPYKTVFRVFFTSHMSPKKHERRPLVSMAFHSKVSITP
jgi:hypothetical protein